MTRAFEAPAASPKPASRKPKPRDELSSTVAFEAPPQDMARPPSRATGTAAPTAGRRARKKKSLSSTIAFGAEEVAAAHEEIAQAQTRLQGSASPNVTRGFEMPSAPPSDDEGPKTQAFGAVPMAGSATPTPVPPAPGQNEPSAAAPAPAPVPTPAAPDPGASRRKNRNFSSTIAFGAEELNLARLEATGQGQTEGQTGDPGKASLSSTMAFEAPSAAEPGSPAAGGGPAQARKQSMSSTMAFAPPADGGIAVPTGGAGTGGAAAGPTAPAAERSQNLSSTLAFEAPSAPSPEEPSGAAAAAAPGGDGTARKQTMMGMAAPMGEAASPPVAVNPASDASPPLEQAGGMMAHPGGDVPLARPSASQIATDPPPPPRSTGKIFAIVVGGVVLLGVAVAVALYVLGIV